MTHIADELRDLVDGKDARSIDKMRADDVAERSVQDGWITEVTKHDDGGVSITWSEDKAKDGHWGCGFSKERLGGVKLKKGQRIRTYGRFGGQIYGLDVEGESVFYRTPLERLADRIVGLAESDRRRREEFVQQEAELDADFEALPEVFQERIRLRRETNPTFRQEFERYEMYCCKQAVVFAERAKEAAEAGENADEVEEFWSGEKARARYKPEEESEFSPPDDPALRWLYWWNALNSAEYEYDYKRQVALMPGMDDGHSGNTFGTAVNLARIYLVAPEGVPQQYGALAPLVGSKEYGDPGA